MADYNRRLDEYKASNNKDDELIQIKGRNPFLNREIERNEFKRHIIAMLMCNYFNGIGSMMERRRSLRISGDRLRQAREGLPCHSVLRAGLRMELRQLSLLPQHVGTQMQMGRR